MTGVQTCALPISKSDAAHKASDTNADLDALADHETPKLKRRLIASLGFLLVLMYFSMGHMMWGWPLPHWFDGNHVAMGLKEEMKWLSERSVPEMIRY